MEELPDVLKSHYNPTTGILHYSSGLKALIVKRPWSVTIAFAGTEFGLKSKTGRTGTIKTNLYQRFGWYTPMYQEAAGVVKALYQHLPSGVALRVTGHSLGGGLTQFTTAANVRIHHMSTRRQKPITITAFNSAG